MNKNARRYGDGTEKLKAPFASPHQDVDLPQWQKFVNLYTKVFVIFLGMYCLKITIPLNSTMTSSTVKCSDGL
jgi:hypothetical protein